jgi:hypothetical protein
MQDIGNAAAQAAAGGLRSFIDALHGAGTAAAIWRDITNFADDQRTIARQQATDARQAGLADRRRAMLDRMNRAGVAIPESLRSQLGYGLNNADDRELASLGRALDQAQRRRGVGPLRADRAEDAFGGGFDANFNLSRSISEGTTQIGAAFANAAREQFGLMRSQIEDERRKREPAVDANIRALDANKRKLGELTDTVQGATQSLAELKRGIDRSKPGQSVDSIFEYYRGDQFRQQNAFEVDADRAAGSIAAALGLAGSTDEQSSLFGEIADSMEGGGASRRADRARAVEIARRDQGTRRMAREQSLGGRVSSALGFATNDEGRIADFDGMKAGAELLTGTVNSLTNGLTNLFDTLVSGSADAGTAFQAFASGLLTELGKMAVNKGLFYTFEGIAALFSAPPAAPLFFAAGAGLLALGAGLGIAGAATRPQTPAAAADTSTARNLAPRSSNTGASARDLAPVTVVMSSLVPAGPGDAQRARNGLRDARRRGFADGNYAPRKVEH